MSLREILNLLAAVLSAIAYLPYIRAILRKETAPARSTWIIWTSLSIVLAAAMYQKGALNGQVATYAFADLCIVGLTMRYGVGGMSKLDIFCLLGAASGIALWWKTSDATYALVISLVVVMIGTVPTFKKTWYQPELEDSTTWIISLIATGCQVAAIPSWDVENAAQPLTYFFGVQLIMVILIVMKPRSFFQQA